MTNELMGAPSVKRTLHNSLALAAMTSLVQHTELSFAEAAEKAREIADLAMQSLERVKA